MRYKDGAEDSKHYAARISRYREADLPDERYRVFSTDNAISMGGYKKTTGSFLSTKHPAILSLYMSLMDEEIGMSSIRLNVSNDETEGIRELLGGKYEMTDDGMVSEYDTAVPIGSACTTYVSEAEFYAIPGAYRALVMLKCIVVKDEDISVAERYLKHDEFITQVIDEENYTGLSLAKDDFVRERMQNAVQSLDTKTTGFEGSIQMEQEGVVSFSVPYSKGFRAFVDGEPCAIIDNNSFIAVPVPEGEHVFFLPCSVLP